MVQNSFSYPRSDALLTGTRLLYAHLKFSSLKFSKTGKRIYKIVFIRYNSKIRYIYEVKIFSEIYTYLFFLILKFEPIKFNITKFIAC